MDGWMWADAIPVKQIGPTIPVCLVIDTVKLGIFSRKLGEGRRKNCIFVGFRPPRERDWPRHSSESSLQDILICGVRCQRDFCLTLHLNTSLPAKQSELRCEKITTLTAIFSQGPLDLPPLATSQPAGSNISPAAASQITHLDAHLRASS